ncbi:MAG TPA: hypothetical protein VMV19_15145 [Xanthobacteraceae bacterium]|nr:hypothetical protein [Xanthobacteraceae bacterium]
MKKIAKKRRRRPAFGLVASLCTFVLIAVGFFAAKWAMSSFQFDAPAEQVSAVDRTGIIAHQVGNQECAWARFDNATGRTTGASGCTNGVVFDAHGVPIPVGTIHRLDAISKSFSGGAK